jgi:crotonobetainyl-CoA:carnitine CoA-transferase CaiB-like acyl-CoA transferase
MYDVMQGIRVVEVAEWTFVPAAGAVLADWGADVVKVEHPVRADPQRGLISALSAVGGVNPMFEVGNRGKRSVGIDLNQPGGRDVLHKLIEECDVFLTSFMQDARKKHGLEPEDIFAINPKAIYARGTGHGLRGPDAHVGGYDWASTWCRGGIGHRMTPPGGEPPMMPGSVGDLTGGVTLAGAIAAALFRRERTGKGAIVDNSLYSVGTWLTCQGIVGAGLGAPHQYSSRANALNPVVNTYKTSDDRWICLCMLQADRWWPDLCRRLGREDLIDDPRFNEQTIRNQNQDECIAELEKIFETRTYKEWIEALTGAEGVWAPVQSLAEIAEDPQARVNGFVTQVGEEGQPGSYFGVASPGQFDEETIGELRPSPEPGQHTEEVLLDMGLEWERISELKASGAIN